MKEIIGGIVILWCSAMYWLGGQAFPKRGLDWRKKESWDPENTKGRKWLRRFVLPSGLLLGILFVSHCPVWRSLLACCLLCAALHLGYQAKLWKYAMVGLAYGLTTLLLTGPNFTMLMPSVFHTLFGFVSLRDNRFGWSIVALLTGASIGITYVYAVS